MTRTLDVPGARLHYELRGKEVHGAGPLVLLVGAPMDADSFAPLAELLATEHLVVTTDPRGINRSAVDDRDADSTPVQRADDLSRLLSHLDAGPAVVLGSSGGAISALALVQGHPEQVHTLIAHEPPLVDLLDDREQLWAKNEEMIASYLAGDVVGAWRQFLSAANIVMPEEIFQFSFGGERTPQAAADERFQFEHMLRATARWRPDLAALRSATSRIVVGIGEASAGEVCDRASRALAGALALAPAMFPGGHIGFVMDPGAFADRLRFVLNESTS